MGTEVGDSGASYRSSLWRFIQFRSLYYLKSALCFIASFGSVWPRFSELFINLPPCAAAGLGEDDEAGRQPWRAGYLCRHQRDGA